MTSSSRRTVQFDDMEEGTTYVVHLLSKGRTGFVRLPFGGFISERGKPLVLMMVRVSTNEVISIPADVISKIELPVSAE